jgi:hypothetical protein
LDIYDWQRIVPIPVKPTKETDVMAAAVPL